jgi:acetyl-CoA acetyltransferase
MTRGRAAAVGEPPAIVGVGLADTTSGRDGPDLLVQAAGRALRDAGLDGTQVDGVLTGYFLLDDRFMPANAAAESLGLRPRMCATVNVGGATGTALVRQAADAIRAGTCERVLIAWADNRSSGAGRSRVVDRLASIGHPDLEAPHLPTIPAFYALHAARYLHDTQASSRDLAELAVCFRRHAMRNPAAHQRASITVDDVLASKPIADPLRLLDCCLVTDFGAAMVLSAAPEDGHHLPVRVLGAAESHPHEHVVGTEQLGRSVSGEVARRALTMAGHQVSDLDLAMIYDSFTITAAIQLEDLGVAPRGGAGAMAREGAFDLDGALPLNTHGGMLSGTTGGIHHVAEAVLQLQGRADGRQVEGCRLALVNGIGGVLSAHCSLVLGAT